MPNLDPSQVQIVSVLLYLLATVMFALLWWIDRGNDGEAKWIFLSAGTFIVAARTFAFYVAKWSATDLPIMISVFACALCYFCAAWCFIKPHLDNIKERVKSLRK